MSQSDHQILIQSKSYLYAAMLAGLLSLTSLINGELVLAVFSSVLCIVLTVNKIKSNNTQDARQNIKWLKHSSLLLAASTITGLKFGVEGVSTWMYFVPLLVFFLYDFKPALWLVGIFSILALLALDSPEKSIESVQVTLNYLFFLGISSSLVYLREVRRRQLKPLRRTDSLTTAASREHLDNDLAKEVQRSEREGCDLATMVLAIDTICLSKLSSKEQDAVIIHIGKLLHNNLRLFDSYYLWDKHEFFVVLPHTSSAQAVKIANALRIQVRKQVTINDEHITISIGVSGLNVGDDSHTLTLRAAMALKETQTKSTNRTQLFREHESNNEDKAEPSFRNDQNISKDK
jgi:diguanylate cyclase (GGDEF)-like protein